MIARSTLYSARGGDTVQVVETASQLRRAGVEVDIKLTHEKIDYQRYALLHFFNIIRPADMLMHIRKSRKPYVLSTIHIDYSSFDKIRTGMAGWLFRVLSGDAIEYVKTVSRWVLRRDKLVSIDYLWKGQRRSIREILSHAAMLLPNSVSEQVRLVKQYGCDTDFIVVPNGINEAMFRYDPAVERDPKLVLCAARIEGIKNQLNLIQALNGTSFSLLLIGSPAPNQLAYYHQCRNIASANVRFIEQLPQMDLLRYYQLARVHVLPSWFETTGLSSLEAAAAGCSIVISAKGDTKEYFGEDAFYCDPSDSASIYAAVHRAATAEPSVVLQQRIADRYTWRHAASHTLIAYQKVLGV